MTSDLAIFAEPRDQSLELGAVQSLARSDFATAHRLADRRCRIPPKPGPHCFVLRADALFGLQERDAAIADIARVLETSPEDIAANRRMLAWGGAEQQRDAALALIACDADHRVLGKAIDVLHTHGRKNFGRVTVLDEVVEGWAAWDGDAPLAVSIACGADSVTRLLDADPFHRLSMHHCRATSFSLSRPKSREPQLVSLAVETDRFYSLRAPANDAASAPQRAAPAVSDHGVTVIVPIYADYEATRACLDSLLPQLEGTPHRAILVNDATPDARIADHLAQIGATPSLDVLTNENNLGFVGSVNRALATVESGDVIFLNADTIAPPGFIARLASAARAAPDIGTVTPLSNNGEITSFPTPCTVNRLEPLERIATIDQVAATANSGAVVDMPNGVGFCLYVTRACLDGVRGMSEDYHRGYFEEVDLCLRAGALGFRNVCAASVYVGHAGSLSFGKEKRALVVRNLKLLTRRFPDYERESAAFDLADPLRASRAAIERALPTPPARPRVLVTGTGAVGAVVRERAKQLSSAAEPVLLLEVLHDPGGASVHASDPAGDAPQSVRFQIERREEQESLLNYLQQRQPLRLELGDPANIPAALLQGLLGLKVPYDLFIADAGLLCPRGTPFSLAMLDRPGGIDGAEWIGRWREIAEEAERILVPTPEAQAFAAAFLPDKAIVRIKAPRVGRSRSASGEGSLRKTGDRFRLGMIPVRTAAREQAMMREIVQQLKAQAADLDVTVIGETLDDLGLMRTAGAFVTGPVAAAELPRIVDAYALQALLVIAAQPLFGHPLQAAALKAGIPVAAFDWTGGRCKARRGDLPIDPRSRLPEIAAALRRWMLKS
jgi:O-antigen biosynthesis protein